MKTIFRIFFGMAAMFLLWGCTESQKEGVVDDASCSIQGTWKSEECPLVIYINSQNEVEAAVVTPGEVVLRSKQTIKVEVQSGEFATYQGGEFELRYIPDKKYLEVDVEVKHLEIPFPDDKLEGSVKHSFSGFLSENCNEWNSTWFEFFDYGPRFPMDPNGVGIPATFKKVQE